ncbi:TrmH family RNA methyltransferase [Mycoplasmopsis californica]|nr:RNA methyltransferase [Mycoplasmopsis californica]
MNKIISSTSNNLIKKIAKILAKGDEDYFVIEGLNFIKEAINSGAKIKYIFELTTQNNFTNSIKITENVLRKITFTSNPQGCVALITKPLSKKNGKNIVFCDNVQDPGNIGTIIRSALAFGYDTIFTNINTYNPKILRATQGAIFKINIINYKNAEDELKILKNTHKIYISTLSNDAENIEKIKFPIHNKVIVLGNEGHGVSEELYKYADNKIYIPIDFESLNVAVAAGIILHRSRK